MLQRLLEVRPRIECETVHAALAGVVQGLLVSGCSVIELISARVLSPPEQATFDTVLRILTLSHFLDPDAPVAELRSGRRRVRISNPYDSARFVPARLRLDGVDTAAALLHAFLVLRIRYQAHNGEFPVFRVDALATASDSMDALYLVGDVMTERYPVHPEVVQRGNNVSLTLTGEPPLVAGGLEWARGDYIRSRDASLLLRPLREAIDGPDRPLAIPREVAGRLGSVRVRVPSRAASRTRSICWTASLKELGKVGRQELGPTGALGEHVAFEPSSGGYVATFRDVGTDTVLPVRAIESQEVAVAIQPETADGRVSIIFEGLGGAREIGANCYAYRIGHRAVVIDAGFDATRDGWLGLPALERLPRLDALILTHAHLDHVGALPVLLAVFPNVPVYCTTATHAVLHTQLRDSANVGRMRFEQTGEAFAVSMGLVEGIKAGRFRLTDYGQEVSIPEVPGLVLKFSDAGHIIGSACAHLSIGETSILHTGDISVEDQYLQRGMKVENLSGAHVVMEGTYCGEPEFRRSQRRNAVDGFLRAMSERIDAGGSVLVPAFSLGRAQEIVGLLVDWKERERRTVPIFTVGAVLNELNQVSATHSAFLPGMSGNPFQKVQEFPRPPRGIDGTARAGWFADAFAQLTSKGPCIVVSSHGMMMVNTGSYFIGRAILTGNDERHGVFLCGYMDPLTPGFRLREQRAAERIDYGPGDVITRGIPTENIQYHRLTAHASYEELTEVAVQTPLRSLTLIHGDGSGLDRLRADVVARLAATGKSVAVRAPAIGDRFLLDSFVPASDWYVEAATAGSAPPSAISGDRAFHRETGIALRGITERRFAWIPIGGTLATLSIEHGRIDASRILFVDIQPAAGGATTRLFDRIAKTGRLDRIEWGQLGDFTVRVHSRDPNGVEVLARFQLTFLAEMRPVRMSVNAASPSLEFEIGGTSKPVFIEVTRGSGRSASVIRTQEVRWDPVTRLLRIGLAQASNIGPVPGLRLRVRWPNGFEQAAPVFDTITLEPRVELSVSQLAVGESARCQIRSTPPPIGARFGGRASRLDRDAVVLEPIAPGAIDLELEYPTLDRGSEWRVVGTVGVLPGAQVEFAEEITQGEKFDVQVSQVGESFRGSELTLHIGDTIRDRWQADDVEHHWGGILADEDLVDVTVEATERQLVLWTGSVRVRAGLELDRRASFRATTADGTLAAELLWVGPTGWSKPDVERAFSDAGFGIAGWNGCTLRIHGSDSTIGTRRVQVLDLFVAVTTLRSIALTLEPPGPFAPGDAASVRLGGSEVVDGLESVDGGAIRIDCDRVRPMFDGLSTVIIGDRIHFLHPGSYDVAIVSGSRRLVEISVDVSSPSVSIGAATSRSQREAETPYDAASYVEQLAPLAATFVLSRPRSKFTVKQCSNSDAIDDLGNFVSTCIAAGDKVLVTWPGIELGGLAAHLLKRIRSTAPTIVVAHLSYPAPRGEIAADREEARRLRVMQRILCSVPANSILGGDAYVCVACGDAATARTDSQRMWIECVKCAHVDRELITTLARFRESDANVLFAEYRLAKYLSHGSGRRYAGAFGRVVRCSTCHALQPAFERPAPWNGSELRQLLQAIGMCWAAQDEHRSIRRSAKQVARRSVNPSPGDAARLESSLRRLVDAGIIVDGRAVGALDRLEAGVSLCCASKLVWSPRRVAHAFIEVEQLFSTSVHGGLHPGLMHGSVGARQLIGLGLD